MKFEMEHPTDGQTRAEYGHDHALGYFVEVKRPKQRRVEYDQLHPGYRDLEGALEFLVKHGFFSEDALVEAKQWLADDGGEGSVAADVRRAATVICHLKEWKVPG